MDQASYLRARGRAGGLSTAVKHPGMLSSSGYAAKCARWAATGDLEKAKRAEMAKVTLARLAKMNAAKKAPKAEKAEKPHPDLPRACPYCYLQRLKPMPEQHLSEACKRHKAKSTND